MSVEVGHPVVVAAATQVILCPYDEEESVIWFHLIYAQFATVGIKSQKLKYANDLAILPKQVLRDITIDACNKSDQPFDNIKVVLLGSLARANSSPTLSCFISH
jgi:hypothetical protein